MWKELSERGGLLLRLLDGTAEGGQLVVYLLQLALVAAVGHDAASGLIPKLVVAADEGADGDGLRHVAIQADEADRASIGAAVVRRRPGAGLPRR